MKAFIRIISAFIFLSAPILVFQTSGWGIDFVTNNYWARFVFPVIGSFFFAGIVTGSFSDYAKGWKIKGELNPTRWFFVAALIISVVLSLLIE